MRTNPGQPSKFRKGLGKGTHKSSQAKRSREQEAEEEFWMDQEATLVPFGVFIPDWVFHPRSCAEETCGKNNRKHNKYARFAAEFCRAARHVFMLWAHTYTEMFCMFSYFAFNSHVV